jgi:hypothetical protein
MQSHSQVETPTTASMQRKHLVWGEREKTHQEETRTNPERERAREREREIMAKPILLNHKNNPRELEAVVAAPYDPKGIFSSLIQRCENLTSFLDER